MSENTCHDMNPPHPYPCAACEHERDHEGDGGEPWCRAFDEHKAAHEFCVDHQGWWCRICDEGQCPECVHDPHCRYCHCALFEEYHNWDCPQSGEGEE